SFPPSPSFPAQPQLSRPAPAFPPSPCLRAPRRPSRPAPAFRASARVDVQPYDGSDASAKAAERTRVELADGVLVVDAPEWTGTLFRRGPRVRVMIRLPQDGDLAVTVASADVRAAGRYAAG